MNPLEKGTLYIILVLKAVCFQAQTVKITVDMQETIAKAKEDHYGLNFHKGLSLASTDPAYKKLLAQLDPSIVRYHAAEQIKEGNDKNWLKFDTKTWDTTKIAKVLADRPSQAKVLIAITGWPRWFADPDSPKKLNMTKLDAYADFCAELVDIVNNHLGYNVTYWEPFNEKDKEGGYQGEAEMIELARIYKACRKKMLEKDPNIKMVAAAFREPFQSNVEYFLSQIKPEEMDVFSYHQYGGGKAESISEIYKRPKHLLEGAQKARKKLDAAGFTKVPLWLDEWNIFWTWKIDRETAYMVKDVGAIFDALCYKMLIESQKLDAMLAWNTADAIYGKIKKDNTGYHPGGQLLKTLRVYGTGDVKQVHSDTPEAVQAFVVKQENAQVLFLFINRSERNVKLNLYTGQWKPKNPNIEIIKIGNFGMQKEEKKWPDYTKKSIPLGKNEILGLITPGEI